MAELSTLARPYAKAVFQTAQASGGGASSGVMAWETMLSNLAILLQNPDMRLIVKTPSITSSQCYEVIKGLPGLFDSFAQADKREQAERFLRLLVENRRLSLIDDILSQFRDLKNQADGLAQAHVVSAFPLPADEGAQLLKKMEAKFGCSLKANFKVDNSLIGGLVITVGDQVLDQSVRGELERMRAQFQM